MAIIIKNLEKGKPSEKAGRKVTGLSPFLYRDMAAELPGNS